MCHLITERSERLARHAFIIAPQAMRILLGVIKRFPKCSGYIPSVILAFECRQRDLTGGSAVRSPCPRSQPDAPTCLLYSCRSGGFLVSVLVTMHPRVLAINDSFAPGHVGSEMHRRKRRVRADAPFPNVCCPTSPFRCLRWKRRVYSRKPVCPCRETLPHKRIRAAAPAHVRMHCITCMCVPNLPVRDTSCLEMAGS